MKILHVLSGDFVTGAETSTLALIQAQVQEGHQVFVAAGRFDHPVQAQVTSLPIYNRGFFARIYNILALRKLISRQAIDIVHAHSRAASWVCYWACLLTRTPYLSTLHGRQHLHLSNKYFNVYGPLCVTMCENIREQMLKKTHSFQPERLIVIRNGIHL